jgi:hypothetical protein
VNYELRRKLRLIGVQVQHIGTRLAWQPYVERPGALLNVGEFVQVPAQDTTRNIKPPDPLQPIEKSLTGLQFPFVPQLDSSTFGDQQVAADRMNHDYRPIEILAPTHDKGQLEFKDFFLSTMPFSNGLSYQCRAQCFYSASPPAAGYRLSNVRIDKTAPVDSVWATASPSGTDGKFLIQLNFVNWGGHTALDFDVTLVWVPPSPDDPNYSTYNPAIDEYEKQVTAARKQDYINATRDLVKAVSGIQPRPASDLRAEERQAIYRQLYAQLTKTNLGDAHLTSEYMRELFNLDEILFFVEPDYFLPSAAAPVDAGSDASNPLDGATTTTWPTDPVTGGYLITESSHPAPKGSSLGWQVQLDGDDRRNEFLNAAWVKAVIPMRPGREVEALAWLQTDWVEGEAGLDKPYKRQPGDKPNYIGTVRDVLTLMAQDLQAQNTDFSKSLVTESVFENGFDPLQDGIKIDPTVDFNPGADPYGKVDFWLEVLPTDQVVAVDYDPTQHGA